MKTSSRRSHETARKTPIFACYPASAPDYFTVKDPIKVGNYIIDKACEDLSLNNRSKATVIGFTNAELAQREQDGELYVAFPYDNSRIGVCPTDDFYKSFEHAQKVLQISSVNNSQMEEAFEFLGEFETWRGLQQLLEEGDATRMSGDKHQARLASFKKAISGISWFKSLFSSDVNGFISLLSYQQPPTTREVWVAGPSVLVLADRYDDLHKRKIVK